MTIEFASLTVPREDLIEIHRALLARYLMENALRSEQGLEPIDFPALVARLEKVLRYSEDEAHALFHKLEDELWAFSWYNYTDEWAWFRARQDVLKELGTQAKHAHRHHLERLIAKRYEQKFDAYVSEVDMHEPLRTKKKNKKTK